MTEGSLDLMTLATAVDACVTLAEVMEESPERNKYLLAAKNIADLVEGTIKEMEPTKPKLKVVKKV